MDLNAVKVFVAVVQAGSLSKACEKLDMPIATVSRYISGLEKDLKVQLFDRFKTGVKPTALGLQFYEQVHLSMDTLLNAPQMLQDNQQHLKGVLRLSTPTMFDPVWDMIAAFQRKYPHVQVFCNVSRQVLDLVSDEIDVAIRVQVSHHQAENVIAKPLMLGSAKTIAPIELLAQFGTPQTPQDLLKMPCAGWAVKGNDLTWYFGKTQLRLPAIFATNDIPMLYHFIQQRQAVCQISDYLADKLIAEQNFVEVLTDYPFPYFPINLIYASHRYPSAIVRAFLDFCGEFAKNWQK